MTTRLLTVLLLVFCSQSLAMDKEHVYVDALFGDAWILKNGEKVPVYDGQRLSIKDVLFADEDSEIYLSYWQPGKSKIARMGLSGKGAGKSLWEIVKPVDFNQSLEGYLSTNVIGGATRSDSHCRLPSILHLPQGFGLINLVNATCPQAHSSEVNVFLHGHDPDKALANFQLESSELTAGENRLVWRENEKVIHSTLVYVEDREEIKALLRKLTDRMTATHLAENKKFVLGLASYLKGYELMAFYALVNGGEDDKVTQLQSRLMSYMLSNYTQVALAHK